MMGQGAAETCGLCGGAVGASGACRVCGAVRTPDPTVPRTRPSVDGALAARSAGPAPAPGPSRGYSLVAVVVAFLAGLAIAGGAAWLVWR